jgi:hypothetical protein
MLPWCFQGEDEEEPPNEEHPSFWMWIGWLGVLTLFISVLSEYLVDAIEVLSPWNVFLAVVYPYLKAFVYWPVIPLNICKVQLF